MLYIMRHGLTDWNVAHRLQGQTETDLNEAGLRMAHEAAVEYKDVHFDVCYCSPLKRARMTASPTAAAPVFSCLLLYRKKPRPTAARRAPVPTDRTPVFSKT